MIEIHVATSAELGDVLEFWRRAGEERLRGLGAVRLTAIVVEGDAAAAGLWEAVGYEAQAERLRFIRMLDG